MVNNLKIVVDNKSKDMYNTCIDTEKSVMFFKNLLLRIFLSIVKHIAEVGSVRQGDPIAYVVSVFYNVKILKDMGA
jgi:hypothetical protein